MDPQTLQLRIKCDWLLHLTVPVMIARSQERKVARVQHARYLVRDLHIQSLQSAEPIQPPKYVFVLAPGLTLTFFHQHSSVRLPDRLMAPGHGPCHGVKFTSHLDNQPVLLNPQHVQVEK